MQLAVGRKRKSLHGGSGRCAATRAAASVISSVVLKLLTETIFAELTGYFFYFFIYFLTIHLSGRIWYRESFWRSDPTTGYASGFTTSREQFQTSWRILFHAQGLCFYCFWWKLFSPILTLFPPDGNLLTGLGESFREPLHFFFASTNPRYFDQMIFICLGA